MIESAIQPHWLLDLKRYISRGKAGVLIIQFPRSEWKTISGRLGRKSHFTIAIRHETTKGRKLPMLCLVFADDSYSRHAYIALVTSKTSVTTLESRLRIERLQPIWPNTLGELLQRVGEADPRAKLSLQHQLGPFESRDKLAITISPVLSLSIVEALLGTGSNFLAIQVVHQAITKPTRFRNAEAQQEDAIQTALRAFSLPLDDPAIKIAIKPGQRSALSRINIIEDNVIALDAESIPGHSQIPHRDLTGRALFLEGPEVFEIYTANRGPLEEALGVDLIYHNVTMQSIVMLQYKMLEPYDTYGRKDWVYRPDEQFDEQIQKMLRFNRGPTTDREHSYRLNESTCYLKFIKRDGKITNGGLILPLEHYELLKHSAKMHGPRDGLRLSYEALNGRFLRQGPFLDLIRAGYVGSSPAATKHLKTIIEFILEGNRSLVYALKTKYDDSIKENQPALPGSEQ